jgi:uncharacterized protein
MRAEFMFALPILMGAVFGALLHRGRVTTSSVVSDQFNRRDNAAFKLLLSAILVGGIGVTTLVHFGQTHFMPKDTNLLAVVLGAALFGVGMTMLGYCPGTAIAASATGSLHALAGVGGMIVGAILFALSFDWIAAHILPVLAYGKIRLPEITGTPDAFWFGLLAAIGTIGLVWAEKGGKSDH